MLDIYNIFSVWSVISAIWSRSSWSIMLSFNSSGTSINLNRIGGDKVNSNKK